MARTPIHPGEILRDELQELGVSAAQLARCLHIPASRVAHILHGHRPITAETALRLGRWFGTGPQLWLNLQQAYDVDVTQQHLAEEIETIAPRVPPALNASSSLVREDETTATAEAAALAAETPRRGRPRKAAPVASAST
jgi:addiction module HigA family antidote